MKTNKKSFRKAALPVFGVLAAAVMSLTSVTYAWFTSGNQATVDTINVGVEAAGGLQIAMGAGDANFTWQSTVNPNITGRTLAPASSAGTVNSTYGLDFYTTTYNDTIDKIYGAELVDSEDEVKKAYIKFDLYFRNPEATDKTINLKGTKVESVSGYSNLAVRVAFIEQGKISSLAANQNANAFTDAGSVSKIYEPGATQHTTTGQRDYNKYVPSAAAGDKYEYKALNAVNTNTYFNRFTGQGYNTVSATRSFTEENYATKYTSYYVFDASQAGHEKFVNWQLDNDFSKVTLEAALDEFVKADGAVYTKSGNTYVKYEGYDKDDDGGELDKELNPALEYYVFSPVQIYETATQKVMTDTAVTTYGEEDLVITLAKQTITKYTIYIWLEGQDVDCDNTIASFAFNVDLKFDIVA